MRIRCLGGCREVGGNAFLLDGKEKILLDYGVMVEDQRMPLKPERVDICLLAHAHLDHSGSIPALARMRVPPPVFSTAVTFDQARLVLKDSMKIARLKNMPQNYTKHEMDRMESYGVRVVYGETVDTKSGSIQVLDAGHIPGSCMFIIETEGKRILYTSDFGVQDSRLCKGADVKKIKDIDIVITESTYANRDHAPRKEIEKDFLESVRSTIANEGIALIPSFALGRSAELLLILDSMKSDFPIYLDGMAKEATKIVADYPEFIRDAQALKKAMKRVEFITSDEERKKAMKKPCAIVTTGGCIDGGPAVMYIKHLWNRPECSLMFTGYQIPRTAGRYLLDTGRFVNEEMDLKIAMNIKHFDFSAHIGRNDLFDFINKIRPQHVVCMHGESCQRFATEIRGRFAGVDAQAPKIGDVLEFK